MESSLLPPFATPVPIRTSTPISQVRSRDRQQVTEHELETYEKALQLLSYILSIYVYIYCSLSADEMHLPDGSRSMEEDEMYGYL